jgi:hypothetical protein
MLPTLLSSPCSINAAAAPPPTYTAAHLLWGPERDDLHVTVLVADGVAHTQRVVAGDLKTTAEQQAKEEGLIKQGCHINNARPIHQQLPICTSNVPVHSTCCSCFQPTPQALIQLPLHSVQHSVLLCTTAAAASAIKALTTPLYQAWSSGHHTSVSAPTAFSPSTDSCAPAWPDAAAAVARTSRQRRLLLPVLCVHVSHTLHLRATRTAGERGK